jgi:hypothetical protein
VRSGSETVNALKLIDMEMIRKAEVARLSITREGGGGREVTEK